MGELVSISTGSPPGSLCGCTAESLPPSAPRAPHGSIVFLLTFLVFLPTFLALLLTFLVLLLTFLTPHVPRSSPSSCPSSWSSHSPPRHSRSSWKKPLQSLRHKSFVGCHTHIAIPTTHSHSLCGSPLSHAPPPAPPTHSLCTALGA